MRALAVLGLLAGSLFLTSAAGATRTDDGAREKIASARHVVVLRVTGSDEACSGAVSSAFVGEVIDPVRGAAKHGVRMGARERLPQGVKTGDVLVAAVEPTEPYPLVVGNVCGGTRARIVKVSGRVTAWVRADDVAAARQLAKQVVR